MQRGYKDVAAANNNNNWILQFYVRSCSVSIIKGEKKVKI
jgi:hypothetical protein